MKMCMKEFNDERNILIDQQHFFIRQFLDQCTYWIMDNGAYFEKSTLPRDYNVFFDTLQVCYRQAEDVHEKV